MDYVIYGIYFLHNFRSTLHIFDLPNTDLLFRQLKEENCSTLNGFKNYYLIHVPEYYSNNSQTISEYLVDAPLKFNSLTFAFNIETVLGEIVIHFSYQH